MEALPELPARPRDASLCTCCRQRDTVHLTQEQSNMSESKPAVGVIGLGAMGRGMAGSLRKAGYPVHVFDVRAEAARSFAAEGGIACASPAEVGSACAIVVSVVVNAAQTEEVLF